MRGVDQHADPLAQEIGGKPGSAAKTADTHRDRLARGRSGPAGERQRNVQIEAARQPLRQHPRLGGAAENENFSGDGCHAVS